MESFPSLPTKNIASSQPAPKEENKNILAFRQAAKAAAQARDKGITPIIALEHEKKRLTTCLGDEAFRKAFTTFALDILELDMCCDEPDFNRIFYWPVHAALVNNKIDTGKTTETGDVVTTLFHATYYDGETDSHYGFRVERYEYCAANASYDGEYQYDFEVVFHDEACDGESCCTYHCPACPHTNAD